MTHAFQRSFITTYSSDKAPVSNRSPEMRCLWTSGMIEERLELICEWHDSSRPHSGDAKSKIFVEMWRTGIRIVSQSYPDHTWQQRRYKNRQNQFASTSVFSNTTTRQTRQQIVLRVGAPIWRKVTSWTFWWIWVPTMSNVSSLIFLVHWVWMISSMSWWSACTSTFTTRYRYIFIHVVAFSIYAYTYIHICIGTRWYERTYMHERDHVWQHGISDNTDVTW